MSEEYNKLNSNFTSAHLDKKIQQSQNEYS